MLVSLFKLKLSSEKTKLRLKSGHWTIVLYTFGTWTRTKTEKRLTKFKRQTLRKIYNPKRNEEESIYS